MLRFTVTLVMILFVGNTNIYGLDTADIIEEGKSIPGGYILGMTKSEALSISEYGTCNSNKNPCVTQSKYDGSVIFLKFKNNRAIQITVQNEYYVTGKGASNSKTAFEIASLYEDSDVIEGEFPGEFLVKSKKYGYSFKIKRHCSINNCTLFSKMHTIFYPSKG